MEAELNNKPEYPITIYFRDTGEWVKDEEYSTEMELITGLEFADTEEKEDAWAVKATDKHGRNVSLKIEAIDLVRFEISD